MEVVPLDAADEVAALAADAIEAPGARPTRRGARAGHRLEPAADVPRAGPPAPRRHRRRRTTTSRCFLLDEYVGLPAGHPQSYRATIARELTDDLGIAGARVHGPGPRPTRQHAGPRYEAALADRRRRRPAGARHRRRRAPGVQRAGLVAGLAHPDQDADRRGPARDNARFFGSADEVPQHVLTQGLGTILRARHLLLIADRRGQGGGGRRRRRGPALRVLPGVGAAAAPARDGAARRRGRRRGLDRRRPLPRGVRRQARLAGPLSP